MNMSFARFLVLQIYIFYIIQLYFECNVLNAIMMHTILIIEIKNDEIDQQLLDLRKLFARPA